MKDYGNWKEETKQPRPPLLHKKQKSSPKVLEGLNGALKNEHYAHSLYTQNVALYKIWGYSKLAEHENTEALEERGHAQRLMDRILFLDGTPDYSVVEGFPAADDVPEALELDLDAEYKGRDGYIKLIKTCEEVADYVTRELIQDILQDEEGHILWIETQQRLIDEIGLENFLQAML